MEPLELNVVVSYMESIIADTTPPFPNAVNRGNTSMSDFIRDNMEKIIGEWENFARTLVPVSTDMTPKALRNHIKEILTFIMEDMETDQTGPEQIKKSHGEGGPPAPKGEVIPSPAETHAALRLSGGFNLDQMVSEYRALRASIIKIWNEDHPEIHDPAMQELTRFNEAIDQELTESIRHYSKILSGSKDLFLGILTHDLRNPLGAIQGSAQLVSTIGTLDEKQKMLVSQIIQSAGRIEEIVSHLLDLTRARFGSGLPVIKAPMDFGFVSRQMVAESQAANPKREITLEISGNMDGNWDKARIGQVFSNLLGNALQYSFRDTPVEVRVMGAPDEIILSVYNQGVPIPADQVGRIFDSLTRSTQTSGQEENAGSTNLGLGLYITKEIVIGHGGTIGVTSTEQGGTTFTAKFPRR